MNIKTVKLILFIIVLVFSLTLLFLSLIDSKFQYPEQFIQIEQRAEVGFVFDENFVKNSSINIYCPVILEDGFYYTENLALSCADNTLPQKPFSLSVIQAVVLQDSAALLINSSIEEFPQRFDFVLRDKQGTNIVKHTFIENQPKKMKEENGIFTISFVSGIEKDYRVVGDRLEVFEKEIKEYFSPQHGFSVTVPKNWEVEKEANNYIFYHPLSKHIYPIILSDGNFYTPENTPYSDVYTKINDSLKNTELGTMPDYTSFAKDLDSYFEVDISEGVIRYYGEKEKEFSILNIIDPSSWGGTPTGIYQVISKESLGFSNVSSVYMPFPIRFYGKYLIHGEPYFPSGAPYTSPVSGGCVRVKNENMEEIYNLIGQEDNILVLPRRNTDFILEETNLVEFPQINAKNFLVADIDSGKVFAKNNIEEQFSVFTLSRLMATLIAFEHFDTTQRITVQNYMLTSPGETPGIYQGRSFRLIDLLPAVMINHSKSAAEVLSHYMGRDDTLTRMNEKTKIIGMKDTVFNSISGEAVSTIKDIYYFAYHLLNTRTTFINLSIGSRVLEINHNLFSGLENKNIFYLHPDFVGGGEGFYIFNTLLGEERSLVIFIVSQSDTTYTDVAKLKNWLETSYKSDI